MCKNCNFTPLLTNINLIEISLLLQTKSETNEKNAPKSINFLEITLVSLKYCLLCQDNRSFFKFITSDEVYE